MANSEKGRSTRNILGSEYQVFLSFRGLDTRRGFANSLYHALVDAGIRVFIDDEELRPGERISGNLLRAINDSKLYVPILSKNYASSPWCLRELSKMVENTSTSREDGKKKVILPIFYDVKPDDVKLKTSLYSKAITNLEQKMEDRKKKFSSEDVETWRQALKEVDGTKGWELEKYSGYGDLIKSVVNEVVVRLKTRQRQVTEDLVGMENRIVAINNLLDIDSADVRLIGIYGMGGIGKTTFAKVIFNQLCSYFGKSCSFLDDVRETIKTKGLVKLQEQLLSDISFSRVANTIDNIGHGINMIRETICNKKMLIVLDDVDESNQIQKLIGVNSLYPGTRIIVTTRDKSVLRIRGFKYEILSYEMKGLSEKDALQLFSRHAFDDSSPPANYYNLSKGIVSTASGLPLALEAIGSSLFGRKKKIIWEERLEKLRKSPHNDVLGKLRISYDALEPDQQQIFLDVACFFVGENKTNPMYVWEDCGFGPEDAIDILSKRCMIKVLDDDRFGMHDQFRDLGRAIAKQERTRLWDRDDIICELRSTEIKGTVQALRLPRELFQPPVTITSEQIKRFPHVRFLWLDDVICQGEFTGCLSELKWINLHYPLPKHVDNHQCFEATNLLHPENVVVVNLSCHDFTKDAFDSLIQGGRKLKFLTILVNRLIHRTPTFPENSVLEKLNISGCPSLMEIDSSIGRLRWLTDLTVESCSALRKLTEQIGELRNLRHLSLRNCRNLSELPNSILKLISLKKLDVSSTRITRLPDFTDRPPSLSAANVSYAMSKFLHLQTLNLDDCHGIQVLPNLPKSLTTLRLRSTSLLIVPNLSNLTNLVELLLSDGSEGTATSNVNRTCNLRWIGRLSKLRKLHFCLSNARAPARELQSLSELKELTLYGLELQTLEQLPPNLIVLSLYRTRVKHVHLDGLPPLEKETAFVSSSLRKSRENKVYHQLDTQFLDVFEPLEMSCIQDSVSSERSVHLPEEPGFNELQVVELADCRRGAFLVPSSLKMLQEFHMWECPEVQDIQFASSLESLGEVSIGECISLQRLGGLSNLKNLKRLSIYRCESLQVVEGIDELEFLRLLRVSRCSSMGRIFDASGSKIPNDCRIGVKCCGKVLDSCGRGPHPQLVNWDFYREKILNGTKQASRL